MRCQAPDCHAESVPNGGYCEMHKAQGTFAFSYDEWDTDRWFDRRELLATMFLHDEPKDHKKRLIADLIIHSHDLTEKFK